MKNAILTALRPRGAGFFLPIGILAAAGSLLAIELRGDARLSASVSGSSDTDGDGLVDKQELIVGTSPLVADTDQDGFGDAEELARRTSPIYAQSHPDPDRLRLGMTCRMDKRQLHAVVAVYLPDGDLASADVHLGFLVANRLIEMREAGMLTGASIDLVPAANPAAMVAIIDVPLDPRWVHLFGHLSVYASVQRDGSTEVIAADSIHLLSIAGVVVYAKPHAAILHVPLAQGHTPQSSGTIYVPLVDGGDAPLGWTVGEICYQTSQAVALNGAIVTQEVVSADCQSGWEGSCPPNCSSSVGSTFNTVDPAILIGG